MKLSICFTIESVEFTAGVIDGSVSLGGSESACLGLARALQARGHNVHIFTTKLGADAPPRDRAGVTWHHMSRLQGWSFLEDWDVAIALRQPAFLQNIPAKFRMLWAQDLMANDAMKQYVMSLAWAYDAVAYVSEYHRQQWEGVVPELASLGWATKNGHDAGLAARARRRASKNPNAVIHISRPERGLMPLLSMWPALRKARPNAELKVCRYSSMYDPNGWGDVCRQFDRLVEQVNAEVGGITWLGELGKPALYDAIADAAVMWYPGVSAFAETSCIAAIESQACGTPFVGSYKGALPETVPGGVLIAGDAEQDPAYQAASVAAVADMLDECAHQSFRYRSLVSSGLAHVQGYSYEAVAAEWETWLLGQFSARYEARKDGILRRLDRDDDLVTARLVAAEIGDTPETQRVVDIADRVSTGRSHTAEHYAEFALKTADEVNGCGGRHTEVVKRFDGCRNILDVACGNGAFAILLAKADPQRHVTAIDFSAGNIASAKACAEDMGVAEQIDFIHAPAWDMERQCPSEWLASQAPQSFDGAFVGEFLEHVVEARALMVAVERLVTHMGRLVVTVPSGPLNAIGSRFDRVYRSHVHHFRPADLEALFGQKDAYTRLAMPWAVVSGRGESVGNWIVTYRNDGPLGDRPFDRRVLLRPYDRLTAAIITNDTTDLRRCLDPVWTIADEVLIGDCGCRPGELAAILAEFPRKTRVVPIGPVDALRGGFAEARNRLLAEASGEWFLWIDADETLCGNIDLGKYLDGAVFNGYIVPQNHLQLDRPMLTDIPVRVFRRRPDIQFYGVVHEQPQMGDANGDITPLLQLADVQIAHVGYLHESLRRAKAVGRNLPLLIRDQQVYPERELGKLLVLRDHVNLGSWELEKTQGVVTETVRHHFSQAVALFEKYFDDPTHKLHALGRPFYESALRHVNGALEFAVALVGKENGLAGAQPQLVRVWARTPEQARRWIDHYISEALKPLTAPAAIDVAPVAGTPYQADIREGVLA